MSAYSVPSVNEDLIVSARGEAHITPQNLASIYRAISNKESGIFGWSGVDGQPAFQLSVPDNNHITISSGVGMNQGRMFTIPQGTSESIEINSGTMGKNRYTIIYHRITANAVTRTQSSDWYVEDGVESDTGVEPTPPSIISAGNLDTGSTVAYLPFARIKLNGISIDTSSLTLLPDILVGTGDLKTAFVNKSYQVLTSEEAAGNAIFNFSGEIPEIAGYWPVCINGYQFTGTRSSYVSLYISDLDKNVSTGKAEWRFMGRINDSATAVLNCWISVLYIRTDLLDSLNCVWLSDATS